MSRRALCRTYVAFNAPTEVPTWTEVSEHVEGWAWQYGRQQELGVIQTATGSLSLDNSRHQFDPLVTSGPYGQIKPMRRFKVEGWWNRLTANQASIETDTTGWAAGSNTTIARSTTVADDGVASLRMTSTASGEVSAVATSVPCKPGEPIVGMATFRAAVTGRSSRVQLRWLTGAGVTISTTTGSSITSTTSGWTQATVTDTAPVNAEAVQLIVGVTTGGASEQHYSDKHGVFPADAGTPSWSRGGPEPLAHGYVPSWEPIYSSGLHGGSLTVATHCALGVLAEMRLPESAYAKQVQLDAPSIWWRMADDGVTMRDSSGNGFDGTHLAGSSTTSSVPSSSNAARSYTSTDAIASRSQFAGAVVAGSTFTIEAWLSVTPNGARWLEQGEPAVVNAPGLFATVSQTQLAMRLDGAPAASSRNVVVLKSGLSLGADVHHVAFVRTGASTFVLYVDGVDVGATVTVGGGWTGGETAFGSNGFIGNVFSSDSTCTVDEFAFYPTALSATRIAAHYNAARGWPGLDEAEAITQVLDDIDWPTADRDIGTGASIVSMPAYNGGSALTIMQQLADTAQGRLYTAPNGLVTYRSRWWPLTNTASRTSQATFGDTAGELPWANLRPVADRSRIINRVVAQRSGGELIERVNAASIAEFYERTSTATGLLLTTDNEVVDFADYRIDRYSGGDTDVRALVLDPIGGGDALGLWPQIMQRQIGDLVTVRKRMADGSVILDDEFVIELISHSNIADTAHQCVLAVSKADTRIYLVLDDSTYGVLDTARLAF